MSGLSQNAEKKARQLANLKPFKKGHPKTPGSGRPKKLTRKLEAKLDEKFPNDPQGRTYGDLFIEAGLRRAISRSDVLFREIFERIEGPVERNLKVREEVTGANGGPVRISAEQFQIMIRQFYGLSVPEEPPIALPLAEIAP
jgi:hypothetical protein